MYVHLYNDDRVNRCSLLLDVTSGLQHMHRHHVLHRDIKSHNILLVSSILPNAKGAVDDGRSGSSSSSIPSFAAAAVGGFTTAKITDFGSSVLLSSADDYVLDDPVGNVTAALSFDLIMLLNY